MFNINVPTSTFGGKLNESVNHWVFTVEDAFFAQGINDDHTAIAYAVLGLRGAALSWWHSKKATHIRGQPYRRWSKFVKAIYKAFRPAGFNNQLRLQLQRLRQTGSVREYATQFLELVGQIDDISEGEKVLHFTNRLKSQTRMEVIYKTPSTLERAINLATRYDNVL